MFKISEFIKNKFVNIVDCINCNDINGYPRVVYENNKAKKEIFDWVRYLGVRCFEEILLDIGFNSDDVVYLYEKNNCLEYYYTVNGDNKNFNNYLKLSYGAFMKRGSTVSIYSDNKCLNYSFNDNKRSFVLDIIEEKISNNMSYRRIFDSSLAFFELKNKDYRFEFCLYNQTDGYEEFMILENEDKLVEYLTLLKLPIDILDVYKNIVNICNLDINKYRLLEIKNIPLEVGKKADMLELNYGEFVQFNMTKNGKRICLNNNDIWSYEFVDDDGLVKFSMVSGNNNVSYNISSKNNEEIGDYVKFLLEYDINNARTEVGKVRKLINEINSCENR